MIRYLISSKNTQILCAIASCFTAFFSQNLSYADTDVDNDDSMIKTVFINGLPGSKIAPGIVKANEEICTNFRELYSKDGQSFAYWTYGEAKDVPSDLYDAGKTALKHFKKLVTRPAEICGKECPKVYADITARAIRSAQSEQDPFNSRLTYLSGQARACFAVAGKALVEAPIVGLYHATSGILVVPVQGAWSAFKVGMGSAGTVLYNIAKPVTSLLRYGQAVSCSGVAAVGVGIANACLPDVPPAPLSANAHLSEEASKGDMESLVSSLPTNNHNHLINHVRSASEIAKDRESFLATLHRRDHGKDCKCSEPDEQQ